VTTPTASLDETVDGILAAYRESGRLDGASERLRGALRQRLSGSGIDSGVSAVLELNILGSLAAWAEFVLEEKRHGRNRVPDFARDLRHIFIAHCRQQEIEPKVAVDIAMELATAILDLALAFQRHLTDRRFCRG